MLAPNIVNIIHFCLFVSPYDEHAVVQSSTGTRTKVATRQRARFLCHRFTHVTCLRKDKWSEPCAPHTMETILSTLGRQHGSDTQVDGSASCCFSRRGFLRLAAMSPGNKGGVSLPLPFLTFQFFPPLLLMTPTGRLLPQERMGFV